MSCGDQNVLQPKASADQNVPQCQNATFEVQKKFMEAIVFTKTVWAKFSYNKYSRVKKASKLTIQALDCLLALAGAPVGTPSVCQLPAGPSLKTDLQT